MKKQLMIISIISVVLLAGVLAVKAAAKANRTFTKGTVKATFVNSTDKDITVTYNGKNYTILLKNKKNKRLPELNLVKECTKLKGNAFSKCKNVSITKIAKGDKIKIKARYVKKSKRYYANQIWFYTPPSSGY